MINGETQSIIWDLDGTLIDSLGVFEEVLGDILPPRNYALPSHDVMLKNFHGSLEDTIKAVLNGVGASELAAIVQDFLEVQNHHYDVIEHHIFVDALNLAKRAHKAGINQVLVTNRNHEGRLNASPRSIVKRSSLNGLIDTIVCGDDSNHRKPKLEVIKSLLQNGTIVPEQSLVVGDQFVDAEFARNLGARAVLVARDASEIPHLETLGDNWQGYVTIVSSLDEVKF